MTMDGRYKGGVFIPAEQIATAPIEVQPWLRRFIGEIPMPDSPFVLEQHGFLTSEDGLAVCSGSEIKALLRCLSDDGLACQVLFELGSELYNPDTGEHRTYILRIADFLRDTDVRDSAKLRECLGRINAALCRLRDDRDAAIFLYVGDDGFRVHHVTQHRIYQIWRRLVHVPALSSVGTSDRSEPAD